MTIRDLNIKDCRFVFVFRHRYEKEADGSKIMFRHEFRDWRLGFFFKKNKIVGKKVLSKPDKWKNGLVNYYMLGIDLLICKAWVTFDREGARIEV